MFLVFSEPHLKHHFNPKKGTEHERQIKALTVTFSNFKENPERAVPCCVKITAWSRVAVRWTHKAHLQIHAFVQVKQRHYTDIHIQTVAQLYPRYSPEVRATGIDSEYSKQIISLPVTALANAPSTARKRKPLESSAPLRKDHWQRRSPGPGIEQSAPGRGTDAPPELDTQSDQATGQPPPPSPLAASHRPFRIQLSRAKRALHRAGPRAPWAAFPVSRPGWHHQQRSSPAPRSSVASRRARGRAVAGHGRKDGQAVVE